MDSNGTAKEGLGRTNAGIDGFCPIASYVGSHGFCSELSLCGVSNVGRWCSKRLARGNDDVIAV